MDYLAYMKIWIETTRVNVAQNSCGGLQLMVVKVGG